jgi:signal transduction histidine kinase
MIRHSLPARVALATAGLLALLLLVVSGASYAVTAVMLRQAVDGALQSTLSVAAARPDLRTEAERYRRAPGDDDHGDDDDDHAGDDDGHRQGDDHDRVRVTEDAGRVQFGPADLPVDSATLAEVQTRGFAYRSLVRADPPDADRGRVTATPGSAGASGTTTPPTWQVRTEPNWWQMLTPRPGELRVLYARGGPPDVPVLLQMAAPLGPAGAVLPTLLRWLAVLVLLGSLLAAVIAWTMAAQIYKPLQSVTATAEDITTRTLALRIPDVWPDRTLRQLVHVLNAMIARLQSAFEAQGRFVAAAAHELRGPLAAMRTQLEVSLRRERSPEQYRAALEGALAETGRLSALSEHLLVLARYERGAALTMERDLPLAPLLERTAREVERSVGGQVLVEATPDLLVDGDPLALERVVANLARNAVQAGGAPVSVAAAPGDGGVWLHVRDQGCGISREALPHLFAPFYRADPARGRDGGTGLGLAIVKTIVEAHGGRIQVESAPGQGSAFHVWLPRRQELAGR